MLFSGGGEESGGSGDGGVRTEPIQLTKSPNGMAVVGDRLLWVSTTDGTVGVTPDRSLLRRGQAATTDGKAISARGPYLWVPIHHQNRVVQLDAETGKPLGVIDTEAEPNAIALSSTSVYVSQRNGTGMWVQRYDAGTRQTSGRKITVPQGTRRLSVRGRTLWVLVQDPSKGRDRIARYDEETGAELRPVTVGRGASAMAYSGGAFWVANSDSGTVTRVDTSTLKTSEYELGGNPTNVRVDGAVWVTNPPRHILQRLDPDTGRVKTFKVGQKPYSLALTNDGVWVGDSDENNIRLVKP